MNGGWINKLLSEDTIPLKNSDILEFQVHVIEKQPIFKI